MGKEEFSVASSKHGYNLQMSYVDVKTVEDYIEAVRLTLSYWLAIHTDAECWATEWLVDGDPEYTLRECPVISNNYFSFDLKKIALKLYVEATYINAQRCSHCGIILFDGEECYDCKDDDDCGEEDLHDTEVTSDELMEYFGDTDCLPSNLSDFVFDALVKEGFEIYQQALSGTISGCVEEMEDALGQYDECETNEDLLSWALKATAIYHVHGEVVRDYGEKVGLEYNMVNNIRNTSIREVFGEEEIEAFLAKEMEAE